MWRCGSPVRNAWPKTPTLKFTDSVSGSSSHCFSKCLLAAHRFSTACGDRRGDSHDGGIEVGLRNNLIDQAPVEGGRGVDIRSGQDQPSGASPTNQSRQQRRMYDRRDAHLHLGHAEPGVLCGDAQIAGGRNFKSSAQAPSLQSRNDR